MGNSKDMNDILLLGFFLGGVIVGSGFVLVLLFI